MHLVFFIMLSVVHSSITLWFCLWVWNTKISSPYSLDGSLSALTWNGYSPIQSVMVMDVLHSKCHLAFLREQKTITNTTKSRLVSCRWNDFRLFVFDAVHGFCRRKCQCEFFHLWYFYSIELKVLDTEKIINVD